MENEMMDLNALASYLRRDKREVSKMASRGYLPGRKVSGEWRFAPAEINHWIETQMHAYTEQELTAVEEGPGRGSDAELLVTSLLSTDTIAVPLSGSTRNSVLKELVKTAEQSFHVWDPDAILDAVKQREELGSTALETGVAIPHPHRPIPNTLGDSVIAFGRSLRGVPFGSGHGVMTDLFFLVLCLDQATHLRVLARLSRLMLRAEFLDELRSVETPIEMFEVIRRAEEALLP